MPNASLPISNLHWTVDRPVILSVIRDLFDITQLSHQTPINFYGIDAKAAQQGSIVNAVADNKWPYDERVSIEVEEDYHPETLLTTPVSRIEHQPFFLDEALQISIKPVYAMCKATVSIKYRAKDKNQAVMWRNQMRTKAVMMRDLNLHEIEYSYHIPEAFLAVLEHLHELRENVAGYGQDLNDYFTSNCTPNVGVVSNLSGEQLAWGVEERQVRVQGYFDFEGSPDKGDREEDHDNWAISMSYIFTYQKPISCFMKYPLMIHNQMVGDKYRPEEPLYRLEDQQLRYSVSGGAYAYFESGQRMLRYKGHEGISLPSFDEFSPSNVLHSTVKVLTAIVGITETDRRSLFNLSELGDYSLDPQVIDFLKNSEYPFLGADFRSIFTLSLYRDEEMMQGGSLVVDKDLNVSATRDLDLRKTYHVRLGLVTDHDYLKIVAITRLQNNADVAMRLVDAINASIRGFSGSRPDINKNTLSPSSVKLLTGKTLPADYMRNSDVHFIRSLFTTTSFIPFGS